MSDLISREQAIKDAKSWVAVDEYEKHLKEIVIEWLKEFPSAELSTNLAEVGTDCISRQQAIDALAGMIDRFERILADIRETKVDDSVCGMCEYDGAYIGQSGDWCNECPGFEKNDCFKLSDECRKRWLESVKLPSAQPATNCSEFPNNSDTISRAKAIDGKIYIRRSNGVEIYDDYVVPVEYLEQLPPAQPEQLEQCPIYDGMCAYPSDQCYDCPRHAGAKMEVNNDR